PYAPSHESEVRALARLCHLSSTNPHSSLDVSRRAEASLGKHLPSSRDTEETGKGLPGVAVALVRVLLPVALCRGNPIGVGEADAADVDVAAVVGDGEAAAGDHRDQEPEPPLHVLSPFQSVARPRPR